MSLNSLIQMTTNGLQIRFRVLGEHERGRKVPLENVAIFSISKGLEGSDLARFKESIFSGFYYSGHSWYEWKSTEPSVDMSLMETVLRKGALRPLSEEDIRECWKEALKLSVFELLDELLILKNSQIKTGRELFMKGKTQ